MLDDSEGPKFNSKGYLVNFDDWDKELAIKMAGEHGVELTDCHWLIIHFLREYYVEFGIAPEPREIIKELGPKINHTMPCNRKNLEALFAEGGCKLACQVAGLPDSYCKGC